MRTANISHGQHGYKIHVREEPAWSIAWEYIHEWLLTAAGSPCCDFRHGTEKRSWAGWVYDHLPDNSAEGSLRDRWSVLQWRLLNNRLTNRVHGTDLFAFPISDRQAEIYDKKFFDHCAELELDEPAEPTMSISGNTFTLSSGINLTWSGTTTGEPT